MGSRILPAGLAARLDHHARHLQAALGDESNASLVFLLKDVARGTGLQCRLLSAFGALLGLSLELK